MAFNISAGRAAGGVGNTKQRLVLIAIVIGAIFLVGFVLTGTKKKKKSTLPPLETNSIAAPTTPSAVTQYRQNLDDSVQLYKQQVANGTAPTPTTNGSSYPGGRPTPYAAQTTAPYGRQPYSSMPGQPTIPPTAYTQPGYAPPHEISGPSAYGNLIRNENAANNGHVDELTRKRAESIYQAQFGSSVAKSIRAEDTPASPTPQQTIPASGKFTLPPGVTMPAQIPIGLGAQAAQMIGEQMRAATGAKTSQSATKEQVATEKPKHPQREPGTFLIPEGTIIDTVLQTQLNGSFAGPAKVMVTDPVYDRARRIVLIPAGSILLGDVRAVQKIGEERLAVTFHRLQRTDGYDKDLDTFTGLDQIGETALKDKVDHHYLQVFGVSIALGAVSGLAMMNSNYGYNTSGTSLYEEGFSQSLDQSADRILDRYTNILPTITIRYGTRVKVYLTNDLYLPPALDKPILD